MTADYTVLGQYPTTEYLGGTTTRAVTAVQYQTNPNSIYFESRIPDTALTTDEVDNTGKVNGGALEALYGITGVTDVEWTQASTPSGYLKDQIIVYYTTPSENSSGSLTTPFTGITTAKVKTAVDAAVAKLTEIENL